MQDDEFFAENPDRRYRVRSPGPGEVPGGDPLQAVLVRPCGPGRYLRCPLPSDLDDFANATEDDLSSLAASTGYAVDCAAKKFISLADTADRLERRVKRRNQ